MVDLQLIQSKIYEIRGHKVMIDRDLAELYQVTTGNLNKSVQRNIKRFPSDFMFQLTKEEANNLYSSGVFQTGIPQYNFSAYAPFAFTEQGVAMLSSVLRSSIAVKVNINIMRAFVSVRQFVLTNESNTKEIEYLKHRIEELEHQGVKAFAMIERLGEETLETINDLSEDNRKEFDNVYLALSQLADKKKQPKPRNPIGFRK
jgi:hypothetical protein